MNEPAFAFLSVCAITDFSPIGSDLKRQFRTHLVQEASTHCFRTTQEGEKLVSARSARQGTSVALSADGNIAIVGGFVEDGGGGAGLVFTRSGGHWTLDNKLVGTSAVGKSAPSVGLSADGSVAMVGGSNDNGGIGAVWVFARSSGGWSQDKKLIGTGAMGKSTPSVALSADRSR